MKKLTQRQLNFIKILNMTERTVRRNLRFGHLNIKIIESLRMLRQENIINTYIETHIFTESELEKARQVIRYNSLTGFTPKTYIAYKATKGTK